MKLTGAHVAAARELLRLNQNELAKIVGVGLATIVRFETGSADPHASTIVKIQSELERRGIEFSNGEGVGVRLIYAKAAEYSRTATPSRSDSGE